MNFNEKNIVIAGIGGVGGFLGAALAAEYDHVSFYARGKRKEAIKENGLRLKSEFIGDRFVRPEIVSDNISDFKTADILIISVKNYSLETICKKLIPIVNENTIILPVLNGVDPAERTRNIFKKGIVIDSLIYIISSSEPDFNICQKGPYATLHIGTIFNDARFKKSVQTAYELFAPTGVTCIVDEDIESAIWQKYIFNCGFNILTAAYKATVGEVRDHNDRVEDMKTLLNEACKVARAKNIKLPEDFEEERFNFFMTNQANDGTSSLKRDICARRPTELETFSGYLVREAKKYNIEVPRTCYYYDKLRQMTATNLYELGLESIKQGNKEDAMNYLGDSLYIRRHFFKEDDIAIREIIYALEQCTFM